MTRTSRGCAKSETARHWPGEGIDAPDQHLVTTINLLSVDAWHDVFGRAYKTLIGDGVMMMMSAHIALPSYAAKHGMVGLGRYRPALVSILNQGVGKPIVSTLYPASVITRINSLWPTCAIFSGEFFFGSCSASTTNQPS